MRLAILGFIVCATIGCKSVPSWHHVSSLSLDGINPLGLASIGDELWVSDSDHNQLVRLDASGKILGYETDFDRPMHITGYATSLYVPEYGKDQITVVNASREALSLIDSLDAPAAVDVSDGVYAIADFYNHRIIYGSGEDWISMGKEGQARGELYYPTDVQIYEDEIYVADAYNNRVQVFGTDGRYRRLFGVNEEINAATGLYVHDGEVFVTDFENDRVIIYSTDGNLIQILEEGIKKPSDLVWFQDRLYLANYKGKNLMIYKKR